MQRASNDRKESIDSEVKIIFSKLKSRDKVHTH